MKLVLIGMVVLLLLLNGCDSDCNKYGNEKSVYSIQPCGSYPFKRCREDV